MLNQGAAFALTLAVELPIALAWARHGRRPLPRMAAAAVLVNLLSHPLAWTFYQRLGPLNQWSGFFALEAAVVLLEGLLLVPLAPLPPRSALPLSLAMNTASAALGLLAGRALGS